MGQILSKNVQIAGKAADIEGYDNDPYFRELPSHIQALSPLYKLAKGVCPHDGIVLDVGANIGVSGILMSDIVADGAIYCIEPSPKNAALLERNMTRNVRRKHPIIRAAMGGGQGTVDFHESNLCGAWNHVSTDQRLGTSDATTTVPMTTIDSLVSENAISRVDLIKIDVEGFETEVLRGMHETLDAFSPVVHMEINSVTTILVGNRSPRDLLSDFVALMGNVYAYGKDSFLEPIAAPDAQVLFLYRNLVEHGCIDDVVGCRDASRLASLL